MDGPSDADQMRAPKRPYPEEEEEEEREEVCFISFYTLLCNKKRQPILDRQINSGYYNLILNIFYVGFFCFPQC